MPTPLVRQRPKQAGIGRVKRPHSELFERLKKRETGRLEKILRFHTDNLEKIKILIKEKEYYADKYSGESLKNILVSAENTYIDIQKMIDQEVRGGNKEQIMNV